MFNVSEVVPAGANTLLPTTAVRRAVSGKGAGKVAVALNDGVPEHSYDVKNS